MKNSLKRALPAAIAMALGLSAVPAAAYEAGDWVVRGRIINVNPNDDSSVVSVGGAPQAGTGVSVDDDTTLELDFTYMLDPHWGLELILGTTKHDVNPNAALSSALSSSATIVETGVLPPTLTLQYHFAPSSNIRPYAGVGINYTHFYNERVKGGLNGAGDDADLDDSWGLAAQVGFDVDINKDWFVNFDVKYIDIDTEATITNTGPFTTSPVKVDVDIDPWVWGIGIGTTF
jgi:outer membrane protein